jgi:hypothetical protein
MKIIFAWWKMRRFLSREKDELEIFFCKMWEVCGKKKEFSKKAPTQIEFKNASQTSSKKFTHDNKRFNFPQFEYYTVYFHIFLSTES